MMLSKDTAILTAALDTCAMPLPQPVRDAQGSLDAATALRQQVEAAPGPDENTFTAKGLPKLLDAIVEHRATRELRLEAARRLERTAQARVADAWAQSTWALMQPLGEVFDATAATFTAAVTVLDGDVDLTSGVRQPDAYHQALDAAETLRVLAEARDVIAHHAVATGIMPKPLDRLSRVCTVASMEHVLGVLPIRAGQLRNYSPGWWAALATTPGVTLKWHTPAEQHAMAATLPAHAKREHGAVVA